MKEKEINLEGEKRKFKLKGWMIGGIVGFIYSCGGIFVTIASAFVGYDCPIVINSFVDAIFYPMLSTSCLQIFRGKGLTGLFIYSILNLIIFTLIGLLIGRLLQIKK